LEPYKGAELDAMLRKPPATIVNAIGRADKRTMALWRGEPKSTMDYPWRMLLLFELYGGLFHRNFSIVVLEDDPGLRHGWSEHWVHDMLGDREKSNVFAKYIKKFLDGRRLEQRYKNSIEQDWRWVCTKFHAERDVFMRYSGADDPEDAFERYINHIVDFVLKWCRQRSPGVLVEFREKLSRASLGELPTLPNGVHEDLRIRKMINFFYLHGN